MKWGKLLGVMPAGVAHVIVPTVNSHHDVSAIHHENHIPEETFAAAPLQDVTIQLVNDRVLEIRTGPAAPKETYLVPGGLLLVSMKCYIEWRVRTPEFVWTSGEAIGSGTAGHFRVLECGQVVAQGTISMVGEGGEGGEMEFSNTIVVSGGLVALRSDSLTLQHVAG